MNIEPFLANYKNKDYSEPNTKTWDTNNEETEYLFSNFGGLSIESGAFRIHTSESAKKWAGIIAATFPGYKDKIIPYGFDWLGRQYAISTQRKGVIIMFDGCTGEDFQLEQTLEGFFNEDLVDYGADILDSNNFEVWNTGKVALKYNEMVAFKIPLMLGGKDSPENYHIIDAEVDWEISRQMLGL